MLEMEPEGFSLDIGPPEASVLASPLLDLLRSREVSYHKEAYVRISVLFAASCILISLHPSFITSALTEGNADILKGLEWVRTWALNVAESDTNKECYTAELLQKKYEEKYKQVAEIASKLTIEEAAFHDVQIGLPGFDSMPLDMLSKHECASYCIRYWESQFKKSQVGVRNVGILFVDIDCGLHVSMVAGAVGWGPQSSQASGTTC